MNKNIIEGKWDQLKGEVQQKWGKLTDDQVDEIEGDRKKFLGKLQEAYGYSEETAEKELEAWEETLAA